MAAITVPSGAVAKTVQLVATFSGYDTSSIKAGENLQIDVPGQSIAPDAGVNTVCTYIAEQASTSGLIGSTPEQQAQVHEWLAKCHTLLTPLKDAELMKINDDLLTRTYLVGSSLTLADLMVYAKVSEAVVNFPVAQHFHFQNLLRWYDLVHHTADKARIFPAASFIKSKFQAPAPPTPQPKAAAAAGATDGKKGAPAADGKKAAPAAAEGGKAAKGAAPAAAAAAAPVAAPAAPAAAADGAAAAAPTAGGKEKGGKKEKKEKQPKEGGGKGGNDKKADDEARIDMLDVRVGQIVKVDRHPNADALYLEQIDLGEGQPRQVISGLVRFVPIEQMQDRRVLVVCNLKPAKMRDVMSYGMVLCASDDSHEKCDPVNPPEGVPIGERITVPGYDNAPLEEINPKRKILEKLFPDMKTSADGTVVYKDAPFTTSQGSVTATIPNAWVK